MSRKRVSLMCVLAACLVLASGSQGAELLMSPLDPGLEGNQFGKSVAMGDVNNDGYADAIVTSEVQNGVLIYFGGEGGVIDSDVDVEISDSGSGAGFGYVVACGDLDGDGGDDIVLGGALGYNGIYVYWGDNLEAENGPEDADVFIADVFNESFLIVSIFGAIVGDVDEDGRDDLAIVTVEIQPGMENDETRVNLFYSSNLVNGLDVMDADVIFRHTGASSSRIIASNDNADRVGGDSIAFVGSANGESAVFVFHAPIAPGTHEASAADAIITSSSETFGSSLAWGGQLDDQPGYDLLIGDPGYASDLGRVYLFNSTGLSGSLSPANADLIITGEDAGGRFGAAVARAGDVNGRGYDDVIVGAPDAGVGERGRAYLFHGDEIVSLPQPTAADAAVVLDANESDGEAFGYVVTGGRDMDGDSFDDIIIGDPLLDIDLGEFTIVDSGQIYAYDVHDYLTIHVPSDYPTIAEAMTVATRYDTVQVAPGPHAEHDIPMTNLVTLRGYVGQNPTVVDAQNQGRGVVFDHPHGVAWIEDLRFNNCYTEYDGGGVYLPGSTGTTLYASNCSFTNGTADNGAGVFAEGSIVHLTNCGFFNNTAREDGAGVAILAGAGSTVDGCQFGNNVADGEGGGLSCDDSAPTISDCVFDGNVANSGGGGGMYCLDSMPTITDCEFDGNRAESGGGGGILFYRCTGTVEQSEFTGNFGFWGGGGISLDESATGIEFCLFVSDDGRSWGDALNFTNVTANGTVTSCTMYGGAGDGPTVYTRLGAAPSIDSSLIVFSEAGIAGGCDAGSSFTLSCCDVFGNAGGDYVGGFDDQDESNIEADPRFCDAEGGDFSLRANSDCLNGGGHPDCSLIGAFGLGCLAIYLIAVDGTGDFPTIQAAIDDSDDGYIIELGDGTFDGSLPGNHDLDFNGLDLIIRSQSGDPAACIIDLAATTRDERRAFVFQSSEGPDAIVENITIVNGNHQYGGGILISGSSPTLRNVVVDHCEAEASGGGVYITQGSSPLLTACTFSYNQAVGNGGAVVLYTGGSAVLDDCEFVGNSAGNDGGAVYGRNTGDTISNCRFLNNTTSDKGGALYLWDADAAVVSDCVFTGNTSADVGGAINLQSTNTTFSSCTIVGNTGTVGGGICVRGGSVVDLDNLLVAFNLGGGGIHEEDDSTANLSCSDLFGNTGGDWIGNIADQLGQNGNISNDPLFCDAAGGDYTLRDNSPCAEPNSPCGQIGALGVGCSTLPTTVWIHADGSGDVATIQEAVDAVAPGGTVLMGNGTYTGPGNRDVDFGTKNLILRSVTNDETACIIDCQGSESEPYRGLVISGGQTADTIVRGVTITNAWHNGGGGLRIANDSDPTVENCVFLDNTSSDGGGIFVLGDSRPTITDCFFEGNSASNAGGALRFSFAYGTVTDCTFSENYGHWGGGGIYFYTSGGSVDDCLFVDNDCQMWGNALHIDQYESNPELENCTIYGGLGNAPSVYLRNDARPGFVNTIIAFNELGPAFECADGSTAEMFSCDIYGNAGGNWTSCIADWLGDDGNIEADPLFCNASGGEFTLRSDSPCAEDNSPQGQIGAYGVGCSINLIHVPGDQPTIQAGINSAAPGDTVMVACDTYFEHNLAMASGVVLISETGHYDCVTIDAQQQGRIFDCADLDAATRIIGFTITGGQANTSGGGARFINCSPVLSECLFTGNTAAMGGGGFFGSYSDLQLEHCVFIENTAAGGSGGGILFNDCQPTLTGCLFGDNAASNYGGAMNLNRSSVDIFGTSFAENSAGLAAGAVFSNDNSVLSVQECTFYGNSSPSGSALRAGTDSHLVLESTIIAFGVEGAAATCTESGDIDLSCCDVYGNAGGDYVNCLAGLEGVAGNISADPLFCDAASGDFTLDWDSPCAPANSDGCGLIGAWSPACGEEPSVDVIGLYADQDGEQNSLSQDTAGVFTLYLIIKNPSDSSGMVFWECALPVPDGLYLTGATLHGGGINFGDLGNFIVGVPEPLPWAENVVVADLHYLSVNLEPRSFYLTATDPSDVDPPAPCYATVDSDPELLVLVPSSGSVDEPVFYLNPIPSDVAQDDVPLVVALDTCFPNPFNPMTTIRYSLPESRRVRLSIYDLKGRLVTMLVDETLPAGRHEVTWQGRDDSGRSAASGTYFYRLIAGDFQQTRSMTLIK